MVADVVQVPDDSKPKAKIFISYSRKDMAFADRLEGALKTRGFEPLIDREEIYAFEDWWRRLQALIAQADTVVFVLSPDSVTSREATREVEYAASLNKRFAPIVCRRVDDNATPEALRRLNFIFFDDPDHFEASADRLTQALQTDIAWIRQHTEYGEAARHWSDGGRPGGLLLRSPALEDAERWIASRPRGAPEPIADTRSFIAESRIGATRRRNILTASLTAGLALAIALAGLAYWQRGLAVEQRQQAESQRQIADQQRKIAVDNLTHAQLMQSKLLASVGNETNRAGDAVTGALLALEGLTDAPRPLAAMDQGQIAASLNAALLNQREQKVLPHTGQVATAEFSPDGNYALATVADSPTAFLWDTRSDQPPVALVGGNSPLTAAHFSPDGRTILAFAEGDKKLLLWDGTTGRQRPSITAADGISSAAISPDNRLIAAANESLVQVWDAATRRLLSQSSIPDSMGVVLAVAFSPDSRRLAVAGGSGTLLWDMVPDHKMINLEGCKDFRVTFSADSRRIVTLPNCTGSKEAFLWDLQTGRKLFELDGHLGNLTDASFSPDGLYVVTSARDATARIWEVKTGRSVAILSGHDGEVNSAAYDPAGAQILTASDDGTARIWDAKSGAQRAVLAGHLAEVASAFYSKDGRRIITASSDKTARIWASEPPNGASIFQGGQISEQPSGPAGATGAAMSPDGRKIAIADDHQETSVWDVETKKKIFTLSGQTGGAYSPDGRMLATVSKDNVAHLWDAETGRPLAMLRGHADAVLHVRFSFDSKRIVTTSADRTIRIWDSQTGQQLNILKIDRLAPSDSKFSFDGHLVATQIPDFDGGDKIEVWTSEDGKV